MTYERCSGEEGGISVLGYLASARCFKRICDRGRGHNWLRGKKKPKKAS